MPKDRTNENRKRKEKDVADLKKMQAWNMEHGDKNPNKKKFSPEEKYEAGIITEKQRNAGIVRRKKVREKHQSLPLKDKMLKRQCKTEAARKQSRKKRAENLEKMQTWNMEHGDRNPNKKKFSPEEKYEAGIITEKQRNALINTRNKLLEEHRKNPEKNRKRDNDRYNSLSNDKKRAKIDKQNELRRKKAGDTKYREKNKKRLKIQYELNNAIIIHINKQLSELQDTITSAQFQTVIESLSDQDRFNKNCFTPYAPQQTWVKSTYRVFINVVKKKNCTSVFDLLKLLTFINKLREKSKAAGTAIPYERLQELLSNGFASLNNKTYEKRRLEVQAEQIKTEVPAECGADGPLLEPETQTDLIQKIEQDFPSTEYDKDTKQDALLKTQQDLREYDYHLYCNALMNEEIDEQTTMEEFYSSGLYLSIMGLHPDSIIESTSMVETKPKPNHDHDVYAAETDISDSDDEVEVVPVKEELCKLMEVDPEEESEVIALLREPVAKKRKYQPKVEDVSDVSDGEDDDKTQISSDSGFESDDNLLDDFMRSCGNISDDEIDTYVRNNIAQLDQDAEKCLIDIDDFENYEIDWSAVFGDDPIMRAQQEALKSNEVPSFMDGTHSKRPDSSPTYTELTTVQTGTA